MGYNQVTSNLQKNRLEMNDLQNQAATQKRINKPSDDPVAAARVLGARTDEKMNKQFLKNIDIARSFLEASDQSLAELTENLVRAKELTIQAANDPGAGAETRRVTAHEVQQIYSQAVQIGNRKLGERYIFGGYKTNKSPFDSHGEFFGDDGEMKIQINKDSYVAMNISGEKVLLGKGLGEDGSSGKMAATPKNVNELQDFKHQEHQRFEEKEKAEKDSENIELRTPASINSRAKNITRVGPAGTDYETTGINVLGSLKELEIGLHVNDKETIQEGIDNLDQAISQVVQARAQVGSRIMALNNTADSLHKLVVENKSTASQLEDADIFQTVSDMQKADGTMKATLETSGKVIQPSLLDFLK
jgi:flagellar hook-associated protein 3 FlgL